MLVFFFQDRCVGQPKNVLIVKTREGKHGVFPLKCDRRQLIAADAGAIASLRQDLQPLLERVKQEDKYEVSFVDDVCWPDDCPQAIRPEHWPFADVLVLPEVANAK